MASSNVSRNATNFSRNFSDQIVNSNDNNSNNMDNSSNNNNSNANNIVGTFGSLGNSAGDTRSQVLTHPGPSVVYPSGEAFPYGSDDSASSVASDEASDLDLNLEGPTPTEPISQDVLSSLQAATQRRTPKRVRSPVPSPSVADAENQQVSPDITSASVMKKTKPSAKAARNAEVARVFHTTLSTRLALRSPEQVNWFTLVLALLQKEKFPAKMIGHPVSPLCATKEQWSSKDEKKQFRYEALLVGVAINAYLIVGDARAGKLDRWNTIVHARPLSATVLQLQPMSTSTRWSLVEVVQGLLLYDFDPDCLAISWAFLLLSAVCYSEHRFGDLRLRPSLRQPQQREEMLACLESALARTSDPNGNVELLSHTPNSLMLFPVPELRRVLCELAYFPFPSNDKRILSAQHWVDCCFQGETVVADGAELNLDDRVVHVQSIFSVISQIVSQLKTEAGCCFIRDLLIRGRLTPSDARLFVESWWPDRRFRSKEMQHLSLLFRLYKHPFFCSAQLVSALFATHTDALRILFFWLKTPEMRNEGTVSALPAAIQKLVCTQRCTLSDAERLSLPQFLMIALHSCLREDLRVVPPETFVAVPYSVQRSLMCTSIFLERGFDKRPASQVPSYFQALVQSVGGMRWPAAPVSVPAFNDQAPFLLPETMDPVCVYETEGALLANTLWVPPLPLAAFTDASYVQHCNHVIPTEAERSSLVRRLRVVFSAASCLEETQTLLETELTPWTETSVDYSSASTGFPSVQRMNLTLHQITTRLLSLPDALPGSAQPTVPALATVAAPAQASAPTPKPTVSKPQKPPSAKQDGKLFVTDKAKSGPSAQSPGKQQTIDDHYGSKRVRKQTDFFRPPSHVDLTDDIEEFTQDVDVQRALGQFGVRKPISAPSLPAANIPQESRPALQLTSHSSSSSSSSSTESAPVSMAPGLPAPPPASRALLAAGAAANTSTSVPLPPAALTLDPTRPPVVGVQIKKPLNFPTQPLFSLHPDGFSLAHLFWHLAHSLPPAEYVEKLGDFLSLCQSEDITTSTMLMNRLLGPSDAYTHSLWSCFPVDAISPLSTYLEGPFFKEASTLRFPPHLSFNCDGAENDSLPALFERLADRQYSAAAYKARLSWFLTWCAETEMYHVSDFLAYLATDPKRLFDKKPDGPQIPKRAIPVLALFVLVVVQAEATPGMYTQVSKHFAEVFYHGAFPRTPTVVNVFDTFTNPLLLKRRRAVSSSTDREDSDSGPSARGSPVIPQPNPVPSVPLWERSASASIQDACRYNLDAFDETSEFVAKIRRAHELVDRNRALLSDAVRAKALLSTPVAPASEVDAATAEGARLCTSTIKKLEHIVLSNKDLFEAAQKLSPAARQLVADDLDSMTVLEKEQVSCLLEELRGYSISFGVLRASFHNLAFRYADQESTLLLSRHNQRSAAPSVDTLHTGTLALDPVTALPAPPSGGGVFASLSRAALSASSNASTTAATLLPPPAPDPSLTVQPPPTALQPGRGSNERPPTASGLPQASAVFHSVSALPPRPQPSSVLPSSTSGPPPVPPLHIPVPITVSATMAAPPAVAHSVSSLTRVLNAYKAVPGAFVVKFMALEAGDDFSTLLSTRPSFTIEVLQKIVETYQRLQTIDWNRKFDRDMWNHVDASPDLPMDEFPGSLQRCVSNGTAQFEWSLALASPSMTPGEQEAIHLRNTIVANFNVLPREIPLVHDDKLLIFQRSRASTQPPFPGLSWANLAEVALAAVYTVHHITHRSATLLFHHILLEPPPGFDLVDFKFPAKLVISMRHFPCFRISAKLLRADHPPAATSLMAQFATAQSHSSSGSAQANDRSATSSHPLSSTQSSVPMTAALPPTAQLSSSAAPNGPSQPPLPPVSSQSNSVGRQHTYQYSGGQGRFAHTAPTAPPPPPIPIPAPTSSADATSALERHRHKRSRHHSHHHSSSSSDSSDTSDSESTRSLSRIKIKQQATHGVVDQYGIMQTWPTSTQQPLVTKTLPFRALLGNEHIKELMEPTGNTHITNFTLDTIVLMAEQWYIRQWHELQITDAGVPMPPWRTLTWYVQREKISKIALRILFMDPDDVYSYGPTSMRLVHFLDHSQGKTELESFADLLSALLGLSAHFSTLRGAIWATPWTDFRQLLIDCCLTTLDPLYVEHYIFVVFKFIRQCANEADKPFFLTNDPRAWDPKMQTAADWARHFSYELFARRGDLNFTKNDRLLRTLKAANFTVAPAVTKIASRAKQKPALPSNTSSTPPRRPKSPSSTKQQLSARSQERNEGRPLKSPSRTDRPLKKVRIKSPASSPGGEKAPMLCFGFLLRKYKLTFANATSPPSCPSPCPYNHSVPAGFSKQDFLDKSARLRERLSEESQKSFLAKFDKDESFQ